MSITDPLPNIAATPFTLSLDSFVRSSPRWLRYSPRRGRWLAGFTSEPMHAPADIITMWLAEQGARIEIEVRIGSSGQHAGVWIGLKGVGATPREAERLAHAAAKTLVDAAEGFRWSLRPAVAPALPRQGRFLVPAAPGERLGGVSEPVDLLAVLDRAALPRYPIVFRFEGSLRGAPGDLLAEASRLRALAQARDPFPPWFAQVQGGSHHGALALSAQRILDEAAGLRVRMSVHSRRLPGELPLHLVSGAISADFGASLACGPSSVAIPADLSVLRCMLHLLSAAGERALPESPEIPFDPSPPCDTLGSPTWRSPSTARCTRATRCTSASSSRGSSSPVASAP